MAEKEPIIVIKKITVEEAGAHGGSWKVAFADFMTAMMAFFLVMWLISQNQDVKENVADYFSTPSIIEYNFSNYGVELTLEKLFLDLINEPLKFFQAFIRPVDFTPNLMSMGSKKVVLHHLADQLGDLAKNVSVNKDEITFDIPAKELFLDGSANPASNFVTVMEKVKGITAGLEDSNIYIDSQMYYQSVKDKTAKTARHVADNRLDLVSNRVEVELENETVDVYGRTSVTQYAKKLKPGVRPEEFIKFRIKQKGDEETGRKPRELDELFGKNDESMSVYDNFVNQLTNKKKKDKKPKRSRRSVH